MLRAPFRLLEFRLLAAKVIQQNQSDKLKVYIASIQLQQQIPADIYRLEIHGWAFLLGFLGRVFSVGCQLFFVGWDC